MRAEQALAKLKVKTVRFDTGVGGIADLTPEDIAAGLAGCEPGPYYLGLYKYSGDRSVLDVLERYVFAAIGNLALEKKVITEERFKLMAVYLECWHKGNGSPLNDKQRKLCSTLHQLARLLVDEVHRENRCRTCKGTGIYQYRPCRGCNGSGRKEPSAREQAKFVNLHVESWLEKWQPFYTKCLPLLYGWEQIVLGHLQRKLYDRKEQELANALYGQREQTATGTGG